MTVQRGQKQGWVAHFKANLSFIFLILRRFPMISLTRMTLQRTTGTFGPMHLVQKRRNWSEGQKIATFLLFSFSHRLFVPSSCCLDSRLLNEKPPWEPAESSIPLIILFEDEEQLAEQWKTKQKVLTFLVPNVHLHVYHNRSAVHVFDSTYAMEVTWHPFVSLCNS